MAVRWDGFSEEDISKMKSHPEKIDAKNQKFRVADLSHHGKRKSNLESTRRGVLQNKMSQGKITDINGSIQSDTVPVKVSGELKSSETDSELTLDVTNCSQDYVCDKSLASSETTLIFESRGGLDEQHQKSLVAKLVMPSISQPTPSSINFSDFDTKHRLMEEQNRARKVFLTKALEDRKKQTHAEHLRLSMIQEELHKLDQRLSCDVSIIRNQIEAASVEFMEAQKRYDRAEKEFLDAKLLLYTKLERKELLTHHLCTIIEQNEMRKAKKLSELMEKLEMPDTDTPQAVEESAVKQPESSTAESKRKISSEIILAPQLPQFEAAKGHGIKQDGNNLN